MKSDPTTPRHEAIIGAISRDVEMLKREKRTKNDWVYVGTYPTDPHTTVDSPPFQNSWANVPGGDGHAVPARFRISPDENLEIEGSFGGGVSGQVAWTLPAGWRRDYRKVIPAADDNHNIIVVVVDSTTGNVTPYTVVVVGPTGATGPAGAAGATLLNGSGAPASGTGADGDFYIDTTAHAIYGPKTSGAWGSSTSLIGPTGATGSTGAAGTNGISAGLKFTYSTDTANTDPTSGKLKFDSVTLSAITRLRISETDGDGNGIAALIQSWDDSTSAISATVTLVKEGAPGNILVFQIAGASITDNGTWDSATITYLTSAGAFSNGDVVRVFFARTGDKGDTGSTGATGPPGADGSTGTVAYDDANAIVAMEVFA